MSEEIPSIIKDFTDVISRAAEVQNRYWLALAVASLFIVVPRPQPSTPSNATGVPLPFNLGEVDAGWFILLAVLMLSILVIAFGAAQAHLVRVKMLVFRILEERRKSGANVVGMDERDSLDALRMPSLSRVASLGQVIRGRYQFFIDKKHCPIWCLDVSAILHVLWKALILIVWLLLPAAVLGFSIMRYTQAPPPPLLFLWPWIVWPMVVGAALSWCVAAYLEVKFLVTSVRRIASKES